MTRPPYRRDGRDDGGSGERSATAPTCCPGACPGRIPSVRSRLARRRHRQPSRPCSACGLVGLVWWAAPRCAHDIGAGSMRAAPRTYGRPKLAVPGPRSTMRPGAKAAASPVDGFQCPPGDRHGPRGLCRLEERDGTFVVRTFYGTEARCAVEASRRDPSPRAQCPSVAQSSDGHTGIDSRPASRSSDGACTRRPWGMVASLPMRLSECQGGPCADVALFEVGGHEVGRKEGGVRPTPTWAVRLRPPQTCGRAGHVASSSRTGGLSWHLVSPRARDAHICVIVGRRGTPTGT